jgi:hypothetical protein
MIWITDLTCRAFVSRFEVFTEVTGGAKFLRNVDSYKSHTA